MDNKFSIVIPAYNEEAIISKVVAQLKDIPNCKEVIVVNDGSKDHTALQAEKAGAKVISHQHNRGYGAGLKTGISAVTTSIVMLFDGDGQHRKEDLLKIIEEAANYDMVVGARGTSSHQLWVRKPGKKILGRVVNLLSERKIPDINSGLRSFKTEVIKKYLHLMPNGFSFSTTSTVALNKMGYKVHYIPIKVEKRVGRKSSVKIFRDGFRTLLLIINLTVLFDPMKVFMPSSMLLVASSIVYFIIYSILERIHVTPSMTLLFITGILVFFMGILCEQVSATRRELNNQQ